MKNAALSAIVALAASADRAAGQMLTFPTSTGTPSVVWAAPLGENDAAPDEIDGVSIDSSGNTVVSGIFRDSLRMGEQMFTSRGEGDIFFASYAPDGTVRWAQHVGGAGDDNTFDLKTDAEGNIVAAGWFTGDVDFGGVTLRSPTTHMFVVKMDQAGRTLWAKAFGGKRGAGGNEISVLPNGEIAVAAISEGGFEIEGQSFADGGGGRDAFLVRMNAGGDVLWVHPFNSPGTERIRGVSMNERGEVFIGFEYRGELRMGQTVLKSQGERDGAVAKLTPKGEPVWLLPVGGAGNDNVRGIAAAEDGSVYAAGVFQGPAMMIDRQVPAIGRRGDDFLVKLSSEGKPLWIVSAGGRGGSVGTEIRADSRGVMISAVVDGKVTIRRNRDTIATIEPPTGRPTSYLAGFSPEGKPRFVYMPSPFGSGSAALGDILAISPDGRHVAQILRFRGGLEAGGREMKTPSQKDSAIVYLNLNGA